MEAQRLSKILGNCPKETIEALAGPVMETRSVSVIRKPTKTLVMVRMQETVAKADFFWASCWLVKRWWKWKVKKALP